MKKTPYDELGVKPDATTEQIKQAYRKKEQELHPDKNPDPGANAEFIRATNAYKLLTDETRRKEYDTTGKTDEPVNENETVLEAMGILQHLFLNMFTAEQFLDADKVNPMDEARKALEHGIDKMLLDRAKLKLTLRWNKIMLKNTKPAEGKRKAWQKKIPRKPLFEIVLREILRSKYCEFRELNKAIRSYILALRILRAHDYTDWQMAELKKKHGRWAEVVAQQAEQLGNSPNVWDFHT